MRPADPDDDEVWLRPLRSGGAVHDEAVRRLFGLLLRVARAECRRRAPAYLSGPELDDLAHQAAADALLAITGKLDRFRGESRFTTWAYRFVILEVSGKLGRHFWSRPSVPLDATDWDRLPDRLGPAPEQQSQWRDLIAAIRHTIETDLTDRQRDVFVALVVTGVPLDALVAKLGTTRGAIYKTMFDARRKIRAALAAHGHLDPQTPEQP